MSFARPDTTTLTLANGDTLVVKRRLNSGDAREMKAMQAYPTLAEPGLVMAYLLDWTITNDGTPVPVAGLARPDLAAVLDNLDEDAFDELHAAVAAHRKAMADERAAQKKTQSGPPAGKPTSESPSAGASPLTASEASTSTTTPSC
jgi:hypothetical protein